MKILIGILVIVLAVFMNSVELGTPLGGGFPLGPGSAPKAVPVAVPSGRRQSRRGGRQGRRQSGSPIQPAAAPTATPPGTPPPITRYDDEATMAETTYIEDPQRGFITLSESEGLNVTLVRYAGFFIGRVQGEDILPIFDKDRNIIRIDINQNYLKITMGKTVARRWGVFGKYADFRRSPPAIFVA